VRSVVFRRAQSRMVVGKREDPNSLVSREPVHLAVFARPHLASGLRITLQGDDREGVRGRASEAGGPMVWRRSGGRSGSASSQLGRRVRRRRRWSQTNRRPKSRQRTQTSGDRLLAPSRGRDPTLRDLPGQNRGRNLRVAAAR
jgi:hypothetical protein